MARNPLKKQVAIAGIGSAEYSRHSGRSRLALALDAARKAIADAGVEVKDIDGVSGSGTGLFAVGDANFLAIQESLDLPALTWGQNADLAEGLVYAAGAIYSGACEVALVVHSLVRTPAMSSSAANEPLRVRAGEFQGTAGTQAREYGEYARAWMHSGEAYPAWMRRYMHDYGAPRELFGLIAINNRTNASMNPGAVMRTPITMEDYLTARPTWEPFGMLDMDLPVDMAEAMILTTTERARDLRRQPVLIETATFGQAPRGAEFYENGEGWGKLAPWVAMKALRDRSDVPLDDIDLFFPYDGYTINAVAYTEAAGYCGTGEAWDFLKDAWDSEENRLKLNGRTLVTTNGGGLSHGRANGVNFYTEAVRQLRGEAGERQMPNAKSALLGVGSFYHIPSAVTLVAE